MDPLVPSIIWAQAPLPAPPGGANPNSMLLLALRRWFAGLTLSSPDVAPSPHGLIALLAGLGALFVLVLVFQGPRQLFRQFFDLAGHVRLVRDATKRTWMATRLVAVAMGFTVLSWTASQSLTFNRDSGKADLLLLTKSRALGELAAEHGILAGLTPLRDVAGLGDNLPLLVCAVLVLFRASFEPRGVARPIDPARGRGGMPTLIWCGAAFYALYRVVVRGAGNLELPLGGCLVIEVVVIPALMLISDGFLLAWCLVELRKTRRGGMGDDSLEPLQAAALMPGAALACFAALPARYIATFVWLSLNSLPTWINATPVGRYLRWQLGGGLIDLQALGLCTLGIVGVVAWSRGTFRGAIRGYGRLLVAEGGHLIATLVMAAVAAGLLSAAAYSVMLLLPAQSWVLMAADAYAHFATLPVGLWTLAALVDLAERSLPIASPAESRVAGRANNTANGESAHVVAEPSSPRTIAPT